MNKKITSLISSKISSGTNRQVFFFSIPLSFDTVRNFLRHLSSATSDRVSPKNRIPRILQTNSARDRGQTTDVPYIIRWTQGKSVVCINRQTCHEKNKTVLRLVSRTANKQGWLNWQCASLRSQRSKFKPRLGQIRIEAT